MRKQLLRVGLCLGMVLAGQRAATVRAEGAEYESLVRDALAEFGAGRFLESRALFLQAHQLRPSARTLRGMGRAAFGAKLYSEAVSNLTAALDSRVNALTPALREEVEDTIATARAHTGRFTLHRDPPDSEVLVDGGDPVFDRDGALLLDEGRRQLMVRAPGLVQREIVLDVSAGDDRALDLSLSLGVKATGVDPLEDAAREEPAAERARAVSLSDEPTPQRAAPHRPFPWLAVGAFGGAAVAGVVGAVQWQHRNARVSSWNGSGCGARPNDAACATLKSSWHSAATWGIVSFGLAGALAATGVLLLVLEPDHEHETALMCTPLLNGVGCQLRM